MIASFITPIPIKASTAPIPTPDDINCIFYAVRQRESTLESAAAIHDQSIVIAYSDRSSRLGSIYASMSIDNEEKGSVKKAWSDFSSKIKTAASDWKKARDGAWLKFKNSIKLCRIISISDYGNANLEMTGQ